MATTPADLGDEQYVLLTTYRRSGIGVPTPVWAARNGDALIVTTDVESGKVKRIRRSPQVTLQACNGFGKPRRGSVPVRGRAEILIGRAAKEAARPEYEKYGLLYRLGRTARAFGRRGHVVLLRITAA
jgi:PPOX class probable F420-dependent enzyme